MKRCAQLTVSVWLAEHSKQFESRRAVTERPTPLCDRGVDYLAVHWWGREPVTLCRDRGMCGLLPVWTAAMAQGRCCAGSHHRSPSEADGGRSKSAIGLRPFSQCLGCKEIWDCNKAQSGSKKGASQISLLQDVERRGDEFSDALCQAIALDCIVVYCSFAGREALLMGAEDGPEGVERAGRSQDDAHLWEAFQELVNDRGRTAAADALGVNYRTVVANLEASRLSRRMRTAVQRFETQESEPGPAGSPEEREPGEAEERGETTETAEQRVEALMAEVGHLRETVQAQAGQLEELGRRVMELAEAREGLESGPGPAVEEGAGDGWRPPRRTGSPMPEW